MNNTLNLFEAHEVCRNGCVSGAALLSRIRSTQFKKAMSILVIEEWGDRRLDSLFPRILSQLDHSSAEALASGRYTIRAGKLIRVSLPPPTAPPVSRDP